MGIKRIPCIWLDISQLSVIRTDVKLSIRCPTNRMSEYRPSTKVWHPAHSSISSNKYCTLLSKKLVVTSLQHLFAIYGGVAKNLAGLLNFEDLMPCLERSLPGIHIGPNLLQIPLSKVRSFPNMYTLPKQTTTNPFCREMRACLKPAWPASTNLRRRRCRRL